MLALPVAAKLYCRRGDIIVLSAQTPSASLSHLLFFALPFPVPLLRNDETGTSAIEGIFVLFVFSLES